MDDIEHPTGWAHGRETPCTASPFEGAACTDVAVVGAGYTGLCCALRLRELGHAVVVLEGRRVGAGASGRNAGQWLPGWAGRTPQDVERLRGPEDGTLLNRLNLRASRELPARLNALGIEAAVRNCGVLMVARGARGLARLQATAEAWQAYGASIGLLNRDSLRACLATDFYAGGVLYRDGGTLDPLAYARGLASAAQRAGATLHEDTPVVAVARHAQGWQLRTPAGLLSARALAVCIDAAGASPWPELDRAAWRLPLGMVMSEPLAGSTDFMPAGVPFGELRALSVFGGMLTSDSRFVASVPPAGTRVMAPSALAAGFDRRFRAVFPGRATPRWRIAWQGVVGMSQDRLPHLCRLGPDALAVTGYSGAGIALSAAYGHHMADALAGSARAGGPAIEALPRVPLPRAIPWIYRRVLAPLARNAFFT